MQDIFCLVWAPGVTKDNLWFNKNKDYFYSIFAFFSREEILFVILRFWCFKNGGGGSYLRIFHGGSILFDSIHQQSIQPCTLSPSPSSWAPLTSPPPPLLPPSLPQLTPQLNTTTTITTNTNTRTFCVTKTITKLKTPLFHHRQQHSPKSISIVITGIVILISGGHWDPLQRIVACTSPPESRTHLELFQPKFTPRG